MKFIDLSIDERQDILRRVQADNGMDLQIIEKDWWVATVLRSLFSLPYTEHISFKGGTNLSKCWGLIQRMSEDIDIAIDHEFIGYGGTLSKSQISDKLRRAACSFVREKLQFDLQNQLINDGINSDSFHVHVNITPVSTTDPEIIEVEYTPVFNDNTNIRPKVIIEVSGRSMSEPVQSVSLHSYIDDVFKNAPFTEPDFAVRAVVPERTFLEKLFLLHEEYHKPSADISHGKNRSTAFLGHAHRKPTGLFPYATDWTSMITVVINSIPIIQIKVAVFKLNEPCINPPCISCYRGFLSLV